MDSTSLAIIVESAQVWTALGVRIAFWMGIIEIAVCVFVFGWCLYYGTLLVREIIKGVSKPKKPAIPSSDKKTDS